MEIFISQERPTHLPGWWGVDGVAVPVREGRAAIGAGPADWFGAFSDVNLLAGGIAGPGRPPVGYAGCGRLIAGSGRLAGDSEAAASLANWGPGGRGALEAACSSLAGGLIESGLTLCVSARAGDVLSDIPSCLWFLRATSDGPFELLLDPVAMLAESMLERAEDHVGRMLDALCEHPRVRGVAAHNLGRDDAGGLAPVPLHRGVLEPGLVVSVAIRAAAAGVPVLLHPDDLGEQLHRLAGPN